MGTQQPYAVHRSAAVLTLLSVLGPMSGLAMEMVLAWRYGASSIVDAFRIASMLAGFGLQLFLGSMVPHVLVPMFAEYRARGMEQEGWRLAFSLFAILSAILLAFIAWVWADTDSLVDLLGPGLSASGRGEAVLLLRCYSLVLLLMAWSGVASAILYVQRVFWLSALAQIVPNLCVVLAVALAGGIEALLLGILAGYAVMLGLFVHGLLRAGRRARVVWAECLASVSREGLRKAMRLAWPLLAGIAIGQWGIVVINRALSELPPGTLAEFGYAWKLLALAGLLPMGLATVIFPAVSDAHASGDNAEFSRLAERALRMTLFLAVSFTVWLYVEGAPLVGLMFGRGGMSAAAQADVCRFFGILLAGAPAGALVAVLNKLSYSTHDAKPPAVVMLFSALFLTVCVPFAASRGGAAGVAWVVSANSWGYSLSMMAYLAFRGRLRPAIMLHAGILAVMCAGAILPVLLLRFGFEHGLAHGFFMQVLELALAGLVYVFAVLALSHGLAIREAAEIARYARWQLRQRLAFGNPRAFEDEGKHG